MTLHSRLEAVSSAASSRLRLGVGRVLMGTAFLFTVGAAVGLAGERVRHLAVPVLEDPTSPKGKTEVPLASLPACRWNLAATLPGRVGALFEASDGTLWMGGFDTGLFHRPAGKGPGAELPVAGLVGRERFVTAITEAHGRLWAATYGGVLELDTQGLRQHTHLRGLAVEALLVGRDGTLWAGTPRGLFRRGAEGFEDVGVKGPEGEGVRVTALAEGVGTLWMGSPSGVYSVPLAALASGGTASATWHPLVFGEGAADTNNVLSLAPLGEGVVAGTDNGGLVWLGLSGDVQAQRFFEARANETNPGAFATRDGAAFFGTQGAGLLVAQRDGSAVTVGRPQGWPMGEVSALASGRVLWVGTGGGQVFAARCP